MRPHPAAHPHQSFKRKYLPRGQGIVKGKRSHFRLTYVAQKRSLTLVPQRSTNLSTVGRTRTVIYVHIRLTDTPFYYFILKIIKKHQPFSAVTRILYIPVTLLQAA